MIDQYHAAAGALPKGTDRWLAPRR